MAMLRSIDLFAGAGGLSLGMQMAGVKLLAAVEKNKDCVSTLQRHFGDADIYADDICNVDLRGYRGRAEIVVGGPPCQPFSSGGLRGGVGDDRNMIPAFLSAIATLQPKAFLMENVRGLVVGERRRYFDSTLSKFSQIGYNVSWKLLNAADYGVPQKRIRLFVVGMRQSVFSFPNASHGPGGEYNYIPIKAVLPSERIGEPNLSKVTYAKRPDLRPSPYHGQLFNGGGRPLNLDQPAPTILASAGGNKTHFIDVENRVPDYHRYLVEGGEPVQGCLSGARRLTIEESAVLQTFPPNFTLSGSMSSRYSQIGNAVPPALAKVLGTALIAHLEGKSVELAKVPKGLPLYTQPSLLSG